MLADCFAGFGGYVYTSNGFGQKSKMFEFVLAIEHLIYIYIKSDNRCTSMKYTKCSF